MLKKKASSVFWLSILLSIPLYIWIWQIGTQLQSDKIRCNKINLILFKVSIIYPLVYFIFGIFYLFISGWFIMPLHYAAMVSSLYAMIFAAKTLKSAELHRKAKISEYLGDIFLIGFFPLGIWELQPRIQKLIK